MNAQLADATRLHKALAHPVRLRMLAMLRSGELCVCQLTAVLDLAPSTVSAHLAELRRAGLVLERKEGRWVHIRIAETPGAGRCLDLVWAQLRGDEQAARDEQVVKRLRAIPVAELCSMSAQNVRCTVRNANPRQT